MNSHRRQKFRISYRAVLSIVSNLEWKRNGVGSSAEKRLPWEDLLKANKLQSVFKNEWTEGQSKSKDVLSDR